jgi:hypothetical protein
MDKYYYGNDSKDIEGLGEFPMSWRCIKSIQSEIHREEDDLRDT